jgi:CubicO group peptidase (beta-lactamase class C family)
MPASAATRTLSVIRTAVAAAACVIAFSAEAREPGRLHRRLDQLSRDGLFSGAVVIRDARGVQFARGYGLADPFEGRRFTPQTPVDSGSLAKPVTAATALMLVRQGRVDLDAPVRRYLSEYPDAEVTVSHLLAHSAGLALEESPKTLSGKTNAELLAGIENAKPLFPPGAGFTYCTLCTVALATLIERVTGRPYLDAAKLLVRLPTGIRLRPRRLADWSGRAIGYRRLGGGKLERFDSWEGEAFYGPANLSVSAEQLAQWGSQWWRPELERIRPLATAPAMIAGKPSGLSWGNWYCSKDRRRCHYLGHHEGFHHMLYWDSRRRFTVAMVSNNTLAPPLQQRLQRALVAFAEGRAAQADRELGAPLPEVAAKPGTYRLPDGDAVLVRATGKSVQVRRKGIEYPAYPTGSGLRYIPGLDVYIAGGPDERLHWLSLYEDFVVEGAASHDEAAAALESLG